MSTRLSLSDKISMTIILVGVFCILLVSYITESYKHFTYEHHIHAIQQLASLEIDDLLEELRDNSLDLALAISKGKKFRHDFEQRNMDALQQHLDNQFYQYFVTAGVLKLLKLYLLDTDFTLISESSEGIDTGPGSELICPQLSQQAIQRKGPEILQTLSQRCLYNNLPVFAVIVPVGGLAPQGYIQIITDLSYNLKNIEQSLAMPVQIQLPGKQISYQSENWVLPEDDDSYLTIRLPVEDQQGNTIMTILLQSDMTAFNREIRDHRNGVMTVTVITTVLMVFVVIMLLHRTAISPITRVHDLLAKIEARLYDSESSNWLMFEELLDHIIQLKNEHAGFCIMLIELKHGAIYHKYGRETGDRLLFTVSKRFADILHGADFFTWTGNDSNRHLLNASSPGVYRASIARLDDSEFALLLPGIQTMAQAMTIAEHIISSLDEPVEINTLELRLRCHIGISIYPLHGNDARTLLRNADKAMQQARRRNQRYGVYESVLKAPALTE